MTGRQSSSTAPRLHVAFVLSMPVPQALGGAERWVSEAAHALRTHATVTEHYIDPQNVMAVRPGVRTHRAVRMPVKEGDRLAFAPGVLSAARADVVHVHHYGTLMAQLLAAVARVQGRPTFVTDHGSSGLALGQRIGLGRLFNGYLCVSKFAADRLPPERTEIVYGGVSLDRFYPGDRAPDPFALYVGRLLPHKGIDGLIQAMPPESRLVIAGRPDPAVAPGYLDYLREQAVGRDVGFFLDLNDAQIADLYRSAWVTVLPTVGHDQAGRRLRVPELLGLVLLESMASATPVIASDLGPTPEIVPADCGLLVTPGSQEALKDALTRLLADRSMVERMGEASRRRVLAQFTWEKVAEHLLDSYRRLGSARARVIQAAARDAE